MYLSIILFTFLSIFSNVHANDEVDPSEYTVSLQFETLNHRCAAAIIHENFLLTAGECFADKLNSYIDVPSITVVAQGKTRVDVNVESVYLPYFYAGRSRAVHDFAVVKLKQSLNLQENGLLPLRLPSSNNTDHDYQNIVGFVSSEKVEIVDYKDCQTNAYEYLMLYSQFCTKSQRSEKKCSGERGSPLVTDQDLLLGIQLDCKDNSSYALFAKVSNFRSIIDAVIAGIPGPYSTHKYA